MPEQLKQFEQVVLPHLNAAYNLAHWLTRDKQDAEDLVQEAYLRAFKFFTSFRGEDSRTWLLAIVRNTFYSRLTEHKRAALNLVFDEESHELCSEALNPETLLIQNISNAELRAVILELPLEFREVIVLHEIEELSYKQIAKILNIPIGTVMSRLARARKRLQAQLRRGQNGEE